jgi:hypothetical protein
MRHFAAPPQQNLLQAVPVLSRFGPSSGRHGVPQNDTTGNGPD